MAFLKRLKILKLDRSKKCKLIRLFSSKNKKTDNAGAKETASFDVNKFESSMIDPAIEQPKVIIIGAGIAGLSAAHRLISCGLWNFTVLEALERPGGRIHSCWMGDVVAEMGAETIDGGCVSNPVYTLAAQEGLLLQPLIRKNEDRKLFCTSDGHAVDFSVSITAFHTFCQIESQSCSLFITGENNRGTLYKFITSRIREELKNFPEDQRYDASRVMYGLSNILRLRYGDDLSEVSSGQCGSLIDIPGGQVRMPLGYVGLLAPLLRCIPAKNICYSKPVKCIQWGMNFDDKPRVIVNFEEGELPADYVIITIPLGVLKAEHECMFDPDLPGKKKEAIELLGFGHINKIFLEYARPFWVKQEGMINLAWSCEELQDRSEWIKGIGTIEELFGSSQMLLARVSGPEAIQIENCSKEEIAISITQLLRKFSGDTTLPYPCNILTSKWSCNPYFRGAYSYLSRSSTVAHQCELSTPVLGNDNRNAPVLFFAGEATCPGHFSTVHGARISGIREAERIIKLTQEFCGPPPKKPICPSKK